MPKMLWVAQAHKYISTIMLALRYGPCDPLRSLAIRGPWRSAFRRDSGEGRGGWAMGGGSRGSFGRLARIPDGIRDALVCVHRAGGQAAKRKEGAGPASEHEPHGNVAAGPHPTAWV